MRTLWRTFLLVGALVFVLGLVILVVYVTTHVNVHHLVADPAEIAFLPEYTGSYSYLGVLVLWSAAVVSVMTGLIVRAHGMPGSRSGFLISFGVLLGVLAADDLFMGHEWAGLLMAEAVGAEDVGYTRSQLEGLVFLVLGLVWAWWLIRFWRVIAGTEYLLLAFALASFGLSVAIDLSAYVFPGLEPDTQRMRTAVAVLEEMLKLAGIFLMFAYATRMSVPAIRQVMGTRTAT